MISLTLKWEDFLSDKAKLGSCEPDSGFENAIKSVLSLNIVIFPGSEICDKLDRLLFENGQPEHTNNSAQ